MLQFHFQIKSPQFHYECVILIITSLQKSGERYRKIKALAQSFIIKMCESHGSVPRQSLSGPLVNISYLCTIHVNTSLYTDIFGAMLLTMDICKYLCLPK